MIQAFEHSKVAAGTIGEHGMAMRGDIQERSNYSLSFPDNNRCTEPFECDEIFLFPEFAEGSSDGPDVIEWKLFLGEEELLLGVRRCRKRLW